MNRIFSLILVCLLSVHAHATTIQYFSFAELVNHSDYVIEGNIESIHTIRSNNNIYSILTINNALVTTDGESIQLGYKPLIRFAGGDYVTRDEAANTETIVSQNVIGTPEFSTGEHVILFLQGNGREKIPFVGMSQGVLSVTQDGAIRDNNGNSIARIEGEEFIKVINGIEYKRGKPLKHAKIKIQPTLNNEAISEKGPHLFFSDARENYLRVESSSKALNHNEASRVRLSVLELNKQLRHFQKIKLSKNTKRLRKLPPEQLPDLEPEKQPEIPDQPAESTTIPASRKIIHTTAN